MKTRKAMSTLNANVFAVICLFALSACQDSTPAADVTSAQSDDVAINATEANGIGNTNSVETNQQAVVDSGIYKSGDEYIDRKVEQLLAQMNLAEKVGQLNQYNGSWDVTGPIEAGDEVNARRLANLRNGGVGLQCHTYW